MTVKGTFPPNVFCECMRTRRTVTGGDLPSGHSVLICLYEGDWEPVLEHIPLDLATTLANALHDLLTLPVLVFDEEKIVLALGVTAVSFASVQTT